MIVVVPMAGRGARFAGTEYDRPKPLITVAGRPMLAWAWKSVADTPHSRAIFIALREHERDFGVSRIIRETAGPNADVLLIDEVTEGQLCTVLVARDLIDRDEDVLIASSDTYIVSDLADTIARKPETCRGIISVADMPGDRWSFARTDDEGRVVEVAEKVRISDHASTGLYYFSNGAEFVERAEARVREGRRTKGEFYVIPLYQDYIDAGLRIDIDRARRMWDMGTPEALTAFLASPDASEA